jgi:hypothetical protein
MKLIRTFRYSGVISPTAAAVRSFASLCDDRWLALRHGDDLNLYDLRTSASPVERIPNVVNHAFSNSVLVTCDQGGSLRRYRESRGEWRFDGPIAAPIVHEATAPHWYSMELSSTGRYLLLESSPIERAPNLFPVSRCSLLDVATGEVHRSFNLAKSVVRSVFAMLPSGQEVLFIAADSYMSLQMVDCASGKTLHEYEAKGSGDFCHVAFELAPGGRRLIATGCYWGGPYELRVYDATPWTENARPNPVFPLPLVARIDELSSIADMVLTDWTLKNGDGCLTCVSFVDLEGIGTWWDGQPESAGEELAGSDLAILERVLQLPRSGNAVVIRRVDPWTGAVVAWTLHHTGKTDERHVHPLREHRVLLVNDRIELCDGISGSTEDMGQTDPPANSFVSLPTTEGATLVLYGGEST